MALDIARLTWWTARHHREEQSCSSPTTSPGWLGIAAGIVIAGLFILRKKGRQLWKRRRQARGASR